MDAVAWRVENDQVRTGGQRVDLLQNVTSDEMAVVEMVQTGIDPGSIHGFFHDLDTSHGSGTGTGQDLGDGTGSTV